MSNATKPTASGGAAAAGGPDGHGLVLARRAYRAPRIERLGDIRDWTLAGTEDDFVDSGGDAFPRRP